jgi:hypothetical protein
LGFAVSSELQGMTRQTRRVAAECESFSDSCRAEFSGQATALGIMPERCYTMLKSLNEFDKLEVAGVVRGLLTKTDRDNCFIGNYYRGKAHIETLLSLKSARPSGDSDGGTRSL